MKHADESYQTYRREFDAALPALVAPLVLLLALAAAALTWPAPPQRAVVLTLLPSPFSEPTP